MSFLVLRAYLLLILFDLCMTRATSKRFTTRCGSVRRTQSRRRIGLRNRSVQRLIWLVSGIGRKCSASSALPLLHACSNVMAYRP